MNGKQKQTGFTRQNFSKKNFSGFTLVEMIIYVAFFAVLSILALNATILAMKSFYTIRIAQGVSQSATTALERMSREIRNAYDINETNSTFATSTGRLTLRTKDSLGANTTIEFYVDGANKLNMKIGGVENGPLFTKTVTLTNLVFRLITTGNSKAIKIEMALSDSRSNTVKLVKFYDTIVLRGSIH
ncbi:MAG: hypothetical protein AAB770_00815 [Patescibacteria group bacterium]